MKKFLKIMSALISIIGLLILSKIYINPLPELVKIMFTASMTLICGISLLILTKIFIEPLQELKKIIGEIAAFVFKSHNLLTNNPDPDENEMKLTTDKLQELSAKFRASINILPWLPLFVWFEFLPPEKDLLKAAGCLSTISYAPYEPQKSKISEQIDELNKLLKLNMNGQ